MRVVLDHIEEITPAVMTFWFKPLSRARYIAGQFIEVSLPDDSHDGRGPHRWFSLSSSPTEPLLAITTKFATDGSTFKKQLAQLAPGTEISFSEPMGDFVLPKDPSIPLLFVGSGIGATPIRSMTKWLDDKQARRNITTLCAGRTTDDMPFIDYFKTYYGPQLHTVEGRRLTALDILPLITDTPESLVYLAGPEQMVEVLGHALEKSGVAKHRIVIDFFSGYTADI